jgi:hypothetical protein
LQRTLGRGEQLLALDLHALPLRRVADDAEQAAPARHEVAARADLHRKRRAIAAPVQRLEQDALLVRDAHLVRDARGRFDPELEDLEREQLVS